MKEANEKKGYRKIEEKFFLQGMYCNSDMYYLNNGKYILLCSKFVLSKEFMVKLQKICAQGSDIYVKEEAYEQLMRQYSYLSETDRINEGRLKLVRQKFGQIVEQCKSSGTVDLGIVDTLLDSLDITLEDMDLSFLVEWTSYMRDLDEYLKTHCTNVAILNGKIAEWMGMKTADRKKAITIGLLHDIGKVMIPSEILNKPAKLTPAEFNIIKKHPVYSCEILERSGVKDREILLGVRGHHEKSNGTGYPDQLMMQDIPPFARITEISDIYDAMIAQRVYKEAKTPFEVLNEFYQQRFSELDTNIVKLFLSKMSTELQGKKVILTNGEMAEIQYIDPRNFLYPIVSMGEDVFQTTEDLRCIKLCTKTGVV